jgi:hypothetical protein
MSIEAMGHDWLMAAENNRIHLHLNFASPDRAIPIADQLVSRD